jgi:hypothetical protein
MKVALKLYQLPIMISPFVTWFQTKISSWNHCSIILDDEIVIHDFDTYPLPRWMELEADKRLFNFTNKTMVVGHTNLSVIDIRNFTNNLPRSSSYNQLSRHLWYTTLGVWPKKNDCVHKVSAVLNYIFNTDMVYSTPDRIEEIVHRFRESNQSHG